MCEECRRQRLEFEETNARYIVAVANMAGTVGVADYGLAMKIAERALQRTERARRAMDAHRAACWCQRLPAKAAD